MKNEFISWVENSQQKYFSEIVLPEIYFNESDFTKLNVVHSKYEYGNSIPKEIVYYAPIPFYLSLEQIENNKYTCICYFDHENHDKVKIFLNTLIKKQKNAINNNTRN